MSKKIMDGLVTHPDSPSGSCFYRGRPGAWPGAALTWNQVAPCEFGKIVRCGSCGNIGIAPYEGIENLKALLPDYSVELVDGRITITWPSNPPKVAS